MSEAMPQVNINSSLPEANVIKFAAKLQRVQREAQPGGEADQKLDQIVRIRTEDEKQLTLIQDEISSLEQETNTLTAELEDIRERMDALDDELINSSGNEAGENLEDSRELILRKRRQVVRADIRKNITRLKVLQRQQDAFNDRLVSVAKREAYLMARAEKINHAMGLLAVAEVALSNIDEIEELPEELLQPFVPDYIIEDHDPDHFRKLAMIDFADNHLDGAIESIHVPLPDQSMLRTDYTHTLTKVLTRPNTNPPAVITIDISKVKNN